MEKKKEMNETEKYIYSEGFIDYLMGNGFSKEVAEKYREDFYYIDWVYDHCGYIDFDSNVPFMEQVSKHFLMMDADPNAIAEFFSNEHYSKYNDKNKWLEVIKEIQEKEVL